MLLPYGLTLVGVRVQSVTVMLVSAVLVVSALAFAAGYVVLYFSRPRGGAHWVFLLSALGFLTEAARFVIPAGGFFGAVIAAVGTLAAGIYVVSRRIFTPIPSLIFLLTVVVAVLPFVLLAVQADLTLDDIVEQIGFALYVVCGIAMILGARTRSTATA
jgi:hypothetical protein